MVDKSKYTSDKMDASAADVAKLAGVSVITVSRALSGSGLVAEKTVEKVKKAALELGYQQNSVARALKTGTPEIFAYAFETPYVLYSKFHADGLTEFETTLNQNKFNTMLTVAPSDQDIVEWVQSLLLTGKCGGIAICIDINSAETRKKLSELNYPIVLVNQIPRMDEKLNLSSVGFNNVSAVRKAVLYLAEQGHKSIAYIGGTEGLQDSINREFGFREGIKTAGLKINEFWIKPGDFNYGWESGKRQASLLLSEGNNRPTAIICAQDEIATGAMQAAYEMNIDVPRDLSVIGFDDHPLTQWTRPPLTSISHDARIMGQKVAEIIMQEAKETDPPPQHIILEPQLVVRQSTAPPSRD